MQKHVKIGAWAGLVSGAGLLTTLVPSASAPLTAPRSSAAGDAGVARFHQGVQPLFKTYCYSCHAAGLNSGGVALDMLKPGAPQDRKLFGMVLDNVRSGIMPPAGMPRPTAAEKDRLADWVKTYVYHIDPANPDPGRVTVRRLNRAEYHNTVRDLLGVDYNTQVEFPPDDAGHGFDNIADALTLSPLLMEKYLNAAQAVVAKVVPLTSHVVAEKVIPGASFEGDNAAAPDFGSTLSLSYYHPATVSCEVPVQHAGNYQLLLDLTANEKYVDNQFDYNRCRLIFRLDGKELYRQEFNRESGKPFQSTLNQALQAGKHTLTFEVQPLTPDAAQIRSLALRINRVTLRGPLALEYQVEPANYRTFFPRPVPADAAGRRAYARELLGQFAYRAFRQPVAPRTLNRLADLAVSIYSQPGQTFEAGVAQGMVAILASPRFLFREEGLAAGQEAVRYPQVDEYALASRLSYFLWSSTPDDELLALAGQGQLRKHLEEQVQRMLKDPKSEALIQNFGGQWLQTRDVDTVPIDARSVLFREVDPATLPAGGGFGGRRRFGRPAVQFDGQLRRSLHREADAYFGYIVRQDRSVLELVNSDYTFLNARLAQYYGLGSLGITGEEMQKVTLPPDSPRGGVLTMGSVLAVTSNPTRTSPVKRGLFILDNILGSPTPPPPANIPPLEASAAGVKDHKPLLREVLAIHRAKPMCASCHSRMDPPGLALENFNAMGIWREKEFGQPIDPSGTLITGESYKNVRELKQILASQHSTDFYRCLTQKLLTYALGRGLEDYDVETVDRIVNRLQQDNGKFSTMLWGVLDSAPFQQCRNPRLNSKQPDEAQSKQAGADLKQRNIAQPSTTQPDMKRPRNTGVLTAHRSAA